MLRMKLVDGNSIIPIMFAGIMYVTLFEICVSQEIEKKSFTEIGWEFDLLMHDAHRGSSYGEIVNMFAQIQNKLSEKYAVRASIGIGFMRMEGSTNEGSFGMDVCAEADLIFLSNEVKWPKYVYLGIAIFKPWKDYIDFDFRCTFISVHMMENISLVGGINLLSKEKWSSDLFLRWTMFQPILVGWEKVRYGMLGIMMKCKI
jgi:hypothetical protein